MNGAPRCCGSGTCVIDPESRRWCGQQWDGRATDQPPIEAQDPGACRTSRVEVQQLMRAHAPKLTREKSEASTTLPAGAPGRGFLLGGLALDQRLTSA